MMMNLEQTQRKMHFALVMLVAPDLDQKIVDLVSRHYPEVMVLYRTLDYGPLRIVRGGRPE